MNWTTTHSLAASAAFKALDAAGLDWMVLRNHQGLPHCNRSKDIDLGLDKRNFHRAQEVIAVALKSLGFSQLLVQDFQYVRCLTFFGTPEKHPLAIKIDLLDGFAFRGAQVFKFRALLETARSDQGFLVPSIVDDAVMLWLKPLVTGGIVKTKYIGDIKQATTENPAGVREILERVLTPKWAALAWSKLEAGDIAGTISLKSGLRRSVWWRAFRHSPFETLQDAIRHMLSELRRRAHRPPATFLAVLGPDGVGKTTFVEGLRARLATLQVRDVDNVQVRHFRPHLFPNISQFVTGRAEVIAEYNNPHSASPAGTLSSILRISYYAVDYVLGYWLKLRGKMIAGQTIIFDRYCYDFIVDPRRSRLSLPLWVPGLLLRMVPKPDLIFVLDAPAGEVHRRKQELSLEEIDRQLTEYRKLVQSEPARFKQINANQPAEIMLETALREIVTRLYPAI